MNERFDIAASLSFTWDGDDLSAPIDHVIVIAAAPSLTKDALSLGYLSGELVAHHGGLRGTLSLTAAGRAVVENFRSLRS